MRIFRKYILNLIIFEQIRMLTVNTTKDLLLWMWLYQQKWTGIRCLHVRSSGYNRWSIHYRYYLKLLWCGLCILCCACWLGALMKLLQWKRNFRWKIYFCLFQQIKFLVHNFSTCWCGWPGEGVVDGGVAAKYCSGCAYWVVPAGCGPWWNCLK